MTYSRLILFAVALVASSTFPADLQTEEATYQACVAAGGKPIDCNAPRAARIAKEEAAKAAPATAPKATPKDCKKVPLGPAYTDCIQSQSDWQNAIKHPDTTYHIDKAARNNPTLGMTYDAVVTELNRGKPLVCNATNMIGHEHLQCWYPDHIHEYRHDPPTMYFDNRVLTSTQNF